MTALPAPTAGDTPLRVLNGQYDHLIRAMHAVHRHDAGCTDCHARLRCGVGVRLRFQEQEARQAYAVGLHQAGIG